MRNIFWLALPLVIAISGCRARPPSANELDRFQKVIEAQFADQVRVLPQEVTVFHWVPRSWANLADTGPVATQDDHARDYLKRNAQKFWSAELPGIKSKNINVYGQGLYGAADPVISYPFGGGLIFLGLGYEFDEKHLPWALFEIPLQRRMIILDMRSDRTIRVSPEAKAGLELLTGDSNYDTEMSLNEFYKWVSDTAITRSLFLQSLRHLGVQAILYTFVGAGLPDCPAQFLFADGFNIVDDAAFDHSRVLVRESVTELDAAPDVAMIQAVFEQTAPLLRDGVPARWFKKPDVTQFPWPDAPARPSAAEIHQWAVSHLTGCEHSVDLPRP